MSHVCVAPNGAETNGREDLELQIHLWSGDRFSLLAGRDDDELYALAAALRQALRVPAGRPEGDLAAPAVERPPDSAAVLERRPEGILLQLPPAGFRRGNLAMFLFGLAWLGFMLLVTAVSVGVGAPWYVYLIVALMVGLGASVLLAAVEMARLRATLTVGHGSLAVCQVGPFGRRRYQWPCAQVVRIGVGPNGMKVGSRDVLELQVHLRDGKKRGFLGGRSGEELSWVASVLKEALPGPASQPPGH